MSVILIDRKQKMKLVYYTHVEKIEPRERVVRGWKDDKGDAQFESQALGWFLHCEGSYEALHIGDTNPGWKVGQRLRVTVEVVD